MRTPRHLWSGDWRAEAEALREERERAAPVVASPAARPPVAEPPDDGPAAASRRVPRAALLGAATVAVAMVAVGAFLLGGSSSPSPSQTSAALPAAPATTLKVRPGHTRAGAIYALASPAVVSIRTGGGSGTGFLVDRPGTIVTNAHVVDTAGRVTVRFGARGSDLVGTVLGTDPSSDLAVVHIQPQQVPRGATPLKLGDSSVVGVGDSVIAIGNPFGLDRTETAGIVSGVGREIQAPNGFQISEAIQTDAAINPGNSGGPLLDESGRVIGVNSQIETSGGSSGNVGVGFAVPVNTLRRVVPILEQGKTIEHPWLGVSSGDAANGSGASIGSVVGGSPAGAAGLRTGDLITGIDGRRVTGSGDLGRLVDTHHVGDKITLHVVRGAHRFDATATLQIRPAQVP